MWDLPRPGLEPVSPASAGRLSTTAPPGKPLHHQFKAKLIRSVVRSLMMRMTIIMVMVIMIIIIMDMNGNSL